MIRTMFDEAFKKCSLDEIALILDTIGDGLVPAVFDPVETEIIQLPLSFYPDYNWLFIKTGAGVDTLKRSVVYKHDDFKVLDGTNTPIYALNKDVPIYLEGLTVLDYVEFFLRSVRGKHGYFHLVQSVDDIQWKEPPPAQARKSIADLIMPLVMEKNDDGAFACTANMMFKNSLFKCDIIIDSAGLVTISNQILLIEDMPIYDTPIDG